MLVILLLVYYTAYSADAPFIYNDVYYESEVLKSKDNYMFILIGDWNKYDKINKETYSDTFGVGPFNAEKVLN